MKLQNLKPAERSTKRPKRIGRGEGSGHGGTATRGNKGAQARSGYSHKIGFEGGQMPIQRRLPKYGFKNPTRVEFAVVNVSALQALSEKIGSANITVDDMIIGGLVRAGMPVKVLGNGDLTAKLDVSAHAFSKSAVAKIEAKEGTTTLL